MSRFIGEFDPMKQGLLSFVVAIEAPAGQLGGGASCTTGIRRGVFHSEVEPMFVKVLFGASERSEKAGHERLHAQLRSKDAAVASNE